MNYELNTDYEKPDGHAEEILREYGNGLVESKSIPVYLIKEFPQVKIRYHRELYPDLLPIEEYGNFIDLRCAEDINLKAGEFAIIPLGISCEIDKGYWMQIVPRSSTFKKYGIIQTNSFGVIDNDYCGDNDLIGMPVYATRDILISANERICQFRIVKDQLFSTTTVDKLSGPDRGGFGSTGRV